MFKPSLQEGDRSPGCSQSLEQGKQTPETALLEEFDGVWAVLCFQSCPRAEPQGGAGSAGSGKVGHCRVCHVCPQQLPEQEAAGAATS